MAISIIHIGLHLDHSLIPSGERAEIKKRLHDLQESMRAAGYNYEILQASPEIGLEDFKRKLRAEPCHGVLIGGGVAGNEAMSYFMEQIIDAAHEFAPQAKVMFFNHSTDVRTTIERWLKSEPA